MSEFIVQINKIFEDIMPLYLKHRFENVDALRVAIKISDFKKIERIGHRMKSSGGLYGFNSITTLGESIETAAQCGDFESIKKWTDYLDNYLQNMEVKFK